MALNRTEREELLLLLEEKARRESDNRYRRVYAMLYDWQHDFIQRTASYSQVCLIAANRIGKTFTGTYIDAMHAMGDYPEGWDGHRFEHAPLIWCLGYSGEKTRDLLQSVIVGRKQGDTLMGGGLIPLDRIVSYEAMTGTANALRSVYIKHSSGETSCLQFWSYSQGAHALMGDEVDWFHIDEEPRDTSIWPQVLTRTASGDRGKGGRGILTFTPENGRTELVCQFMDTPSSAQTCMQKGWDDAPHLDEKVKAELLASFPAHQRDMRTKGIPMLGHGRIYDLAEETILCDGFDIPPHWFIIGGVDFGWDHPQAQVRLAWDKDSDVIYVANSWRARQMSPAQAWGAVKRWQQDVPIAWPADGLQTEKGSGKQQKSYYIEAGFKMLPEHATWPDGSNSVEAGLLEIRDRMLAGTFKVFRGQQDWLSEFLQYHRDDNGHIHKTGEDLLDATRYAYMMRRCAVQLKNIGAAKRKQAVVIPVTNAWGRR